MRPVDGTSLRLGHVGDARDRAGLHAAGIEAVVDLADNEPPVGHARSVVALRFPLLDGEGNPPWLLRLAVEAVAALIRADVPALVHCSAGQSRPPAVIAAALAVARGLAPDAALRLVTRAGPADVSPALWADLRAVVAADAG